MEIKIGKGKIFIVVGGQYGSEAKGLFASHLIKKEKIDTCVRTGSINAGHTVYYKGEPFKNQQIPIAWIRPQTKLVIGAGAYVSPEVLEREIEMIETATGVPISSRLFIDSRCGLQTTEHAAKEVGMHERMGSTGEGVSEAIMEKMRRKFDYVPFKFSEYAKKNNGRKFVICDTVEMLNQAYDWGQKILLEGTQGTMLDLHLGQYPFCTSRQTIAATWLAEAGLSPSLNIEVSMVCRTFPIRVAGNSGPLPHEIKWTWLLKKWNDKRKELSMTPLIEQEHLDRFDVACIEVMERWEMPTDIPIELWDEKRRGEYSAELVDLHKEAFDRVDDLTKEALMEYLEMTTVTKKLRRISAISPSELAYATQINRPEYLTLTFMNYLFPELWKVKDSKGISETTLKGMKIWVSSIERATGCPVKYVSWNKEDVIECAKLW